MLFKLSTSLFLFIFLILMTLNESGINSDFYLTQLFAFYGVFMVVYQLKKETDIKEAEFIMNYNQSFIENDKLIEVEKLLEASRKGKNIQVINEENLQHVIDYLVYIEAMAAMIFRKVLPISHIDDLFMYRFFLAVNNKEIQEKELCPEAEYYKGCFKLYKEWVKYRRRKKLPILMEETSLEYTEAYRMICGNEVIFRKPNKNDDIKAIAKLIIESDSYIYSGWIKDDKIRLEFLERLIRSNICYFNLDNIYCTFKDNRLVSVITYIEDNGLWNSQAVIDLFNENYGLVSDNFVYVTKNYFEKLANYDFINKIYIISFAVDKEYRGKGIGKKTLNKFLENKSNVLLDVLTENKKAVKLYEKIGFKEKETFAGFSLDNKDLVCMRMKKNSTL